MKRVVPSYDKRIINEFLKRYGKTGTYVSNADGDSLQVDGNDYWLDIDDGNWHSNAKGFENESYGPLRNLLFDSLKLAPQLRAMYAKYGVPLEDVPENANRNILQLHGDKRLNTYNNLVKDNPDVFFPNEKEVPEDALDDYIAEPSSPFYFSLGDLLDSDMTLDDLKELKDTNRKAILNDMRRTRNEVMSKKEVQKMLDGISTEVPSNVMDKLNSNVVNALTNRKE